MLRIKDNINLKELEKFEFRNSPSYYHFSKYDASIYVDNVTREITFGASDWGLDDSEGAEHLEKLYDIIKADMVEKVEE